MQICQPLSLDCARASARAYPVEVIFQILAFLKSYASHKGSVDPLRLLSNCQTPVQFLETWSISALKSTSQCCAFLFCSVGPASGHALNYTSRSVINSRYLSLFRILPVSPVFKLVFQLLPSSWSCFFLWMFGPSIQCPDFTAFIYTKTLGGWMKHWKQFSENWESTWILNLITTQLFTCFVSQRSNWLFPHFGWFFFLSIFDGAMQSGTSSGRLGRDVVKGKTKSTKASTGDLEAGKQQNWVHQINQQSTIGSPVDPWMLGIKDWKPGIFLKRIWISSCPVLVSRVARLDASFMILPSLPMGTPSPPRVVGLKPPPKTWHFTFFDHQEGGISARLQDLVDYIITGDFRGLPSSGDGWYMFWMLKI